MKERVQKILAEAGIASRRKCEEFIKAGRVKVNGVLIKLGDQADKTVDKITLDNQPVQVKPKVYFILNKPKNTLCTVKDTHGRKTVLDLIKTPERIFPAGRLDYDTEGLLILTNDGDLMNKITHPRYETKKTYQAKLDKPLTAEDFKKLRNLTIENRKVQVENLKTENTLITLTIHEGRKHIVKKIFEALNKKVLSLKRIAINHLELKDLKPGQYQQVSKEFLVKELLKNHQS